MATTRVEAAPVLAQLKDFQRRTVDYVFDRLYTDADYTTRFLVADEVGLGKTLVARGVIARAIEHLQTNTDVDRIDVIYICSNADIARQNVNRLNVTGRQEFNLPTRITMLPKYLKQLKDHGINFVSFTPGTSFDLKTSGGMIEERALLYWLLRYAWGWPRKRHEGVFRVLQGSARLDSYRWWVSNTPSEVGGTDGLDEALADAFREEILNRDRESHAAKQPGLQERFEELAHKYRNSRRDVDWHGRQRLVGELRHGLARSCVNALEPDLVILDEFQRFRHLLDGTDAPAELAQHLFTQETARVLLLSATPYKMYTLPEEAEAHDDHYADFLRTTRFLLQGDAPMFEKELADFRRVLVDLDAFEAPEIAKRRKKVEKRLKRVMSRTERLAVAIDRNGMLEEKQAVGARLEPSDVAAFLTADAVTKRLGAGDALEYWKSAPYLLNFMESYKLKRTFKAALADDQTERDLATTLRRDGAGLLDVEAVESYRKVDPANARLRALLHDTVDAEAWRLLWLPPSLPYYELAGAYTRVDRLKLTKRLVFSAWWMVPQVTATLVSYEAERRMVKSAGRTWRNTPAARKRIRPLLRVQRLGDGLRGMALFGLMYPSPTLAAAADPFDISKKLRAGSSLPTGAQVRASAEKAVRGLLAPILREYREAEGAVDEAWYWAAPVLIDAANEQADIAGWIGRYGVHARWDGGGADPDEADSAWSDVSGMTRQLLRASLPLGRPPADLVEVVTSLALGAPGTCALRAFARASGGLDFATDWDLRDGAARAAWGFRSLFNVPEVTAMIRGSEQAEEDAYWRLVLDYAIDGGIQSVLDEYVHVLRDFLGIIDRDRSVIGRELGAALYDALAVRATNYRIEDIRVADGHITAEHKNLRARFALRFGTQNTDESGDLQRASQVRYAFNSPFWPFVLASTSVGQEGLDFHLYCHAVVHWNLPANPVDLEQREGRVHRYKGHAIRKNVALANRPAAFRSSVVDPWEALFDAARRGRDRAWGDLVPYWIYPVEGGARIERYVPALPLSREIERLDRLKKSLAVYRLVFGQPRQDDFASTLAALPEGRREAISRALRIDLSP